MAEYDGPGTSHVISFFIHTRTRMNSTCVRLFGSIEFPFFSFFRINSNGLTFLDREGCVITILML